MSLPVVASTLVAAGAVTLLALSMPPDGFFSGDPGVKLIAAVNAADHPSRPFDIDLPAIDGVPARYVERFFWLHGDHSHVLQSPVFPVVTAPLTAAFGLRGAYILPALAFVLLVPLLAPVFSATAPGAPAWIFCLIVVAANPMLFYALELWEHALAVALLAAATALMWAVAITARRAVVAGVVAAAAIVFRPEAAWYALGLAILAGRRTAPGFLVGGAVVLVPIGVVNYLAFGTALGPHAAANLAPIADRYFEARLHRIDLWLVPSSRFALAGIAIVALAQLARLSALKVEIAQTVALAGAALVAIAAASGSIGRDSLWQAWPAGALVLAHVPSKRGREPFSDMRRHPENGSRPLLLVAITFAFVILTSTHDGGAQWGPRFLLVATPALVVLSAWAAATVWSGPVQWRVARRALIVVVLAASVFVSRNAFRELRGAKRYYARLTAATARLVPERGYVLTNVWWFDQITAALYRRHTVLNVTSTGQAESALRDLQARGVREAVIVTSPDEPGDVVLGALGRGTCYAPAGVDRVPERSVTFTKVGCR